MDRRYSLAVILYVVAVILQLAVVPFISIYFIAPNFVLIALIYCTMNYGQVYGTILGFLYGGLLDILSGGAVGIWMFAMTTSGFLSGYFYDENKIAERTFSLFFSGIVFITSCAAFFIATFLESSNAQIGLTFLFFEHSIPSALYTAIFSLGVLLIRKEIKVG